MRRSTLSGCEGAIVSQAHEGGNGVGPFKSQGPRDLFSRISLPAVLCTWPSDRVSLPLLKQTWVDRSDNWKSRRRASPIPATATTNGPQSTLAKWIGKTPRSIAEAMTSKSGIDFTGTPDHVAGMMQDIMEEVGSDGFLLFNGYFDRRYIMEVCDGLVPELQRRGLTRKAYAHKHFRDNLMEF